MASPHRSGSADTKAMDSDALIAVSSLRSTPEKTMSFCPRSLARLHQQVASTILRV